MTPGTNANPVVRLVRTIAAPPDRVYRAWLDPDVLQRWLSPGSYDVIKVEVDPRVGGHFRVWHAGPDGDAGGFECAVMELVPSERIVMRWGFVGPDRTDGPVYDSLLTVTLRPVGDNATTLTLVHENLEALAVALPDVAANVGSGWESVFDKLETIALAH